MAGVDDRQSVHRCKAGGSHIRTGISTASELISEQSSCLIFQVRHLGDPSAPPLSWKQRSQTSDETAWPKAQQTWSEGQKCANSRHGRDPLSVSWRAPTGCVGYELSGAWCQAHRTNSSSCPARAFHKRCPQRSESQHVHNQIPMIAGIVMAFRPTNRLTFKAQCPFKRP